MSLHLGQEGRKLGTGGFQPDLHRRAGTDDRGRVTAYVGLESWLPGDVLIGQKRIKKALLQNVGMDIAPDNCR